MMLRWVHLSVGTLSDVTVHTVCIVFVIAIVVRLSNDNGFVLFCFVF